MPHAALITPTQMYAEGYSVKSANDLVIGIERAGKILHCFLAARAHGLQRGRIYISGVSRRINLNVAAAGLRQTSYDLTLDLHDIGHEIVHRRVNGGGVSVIEAL